MKTLLATAVLAAVAPFAAAQQPRTEPTDPAAPVPAFRYDSGFGGYRGFRDEPLAPWREVNDDVARIGGHVGIVRGAHGGQVKPPAETKPELAPPAGGAGGGSHRQER